MPDRLPRSKHASRRTLGSAVLRAGLCAALALGAVAWGPARGRTPPHIADPLSQRAGNVPVSAVPSQPGMPQGSLGDAHTPARPPALPETDTGRAPQQPATTPGLRRPYRLREGSEIHEQIGLFKPSGERMVFETAGQRFIVLENLNLERIARVTSENPQPVQWKVTGTVTEFRGMNFLLVRRAVLRGELEAPSAPGAK